MRGFSQGLGLEGLQGFLCTCREQSQHLYGSGSGRECPWNIECNTGVVVDNGMGFCCPCCGFPVGVKQGALQAGALHAVSQAAALSIAEGSLRPEADPPKRCHTKAFLRTLAWKTDVLLIHVLLLLNVCCPSCCCSRLVCCCLAAVYQPCLDWTFWISAAMHSAAAGRACHRE